MEWGIFGPKIAKHENFTKSFQQIFSKFFRNFDRHSDGIKSDCFFIFQDNFDYAQKPPLWTFLGAKLTCFIFLASMFCFSRKCYSQNRGFTATLFLLFNVFASIPVVEAFLTTRKAQMFFFLQDNLDLKTFCINHVVLYQML